MEDVISFDGIEGLNELQDTFQELIKKYPDAAGDLLKKDAKTLRKNITKRMREETHVDRSTKHSLGKIGSYKISQIQGTYENQEVDISAKSPHFHLVENGHVLKSHSGKTIGFVQGRHILDNETKKYQSDMPKHVSEMVDNLLKEGGLI